MEGAARSLIKANHSKGWGAKPLAYVPRRRDRVAGLPGEHSTSWWAVLRARLTTTQLRIENREALLMSSILRNQEVLKNVFFRD
jgi:hypothetical protein